MNNTIITSIAGITFRLKDNPDLAEYRPSQNESLKLSVEPTNKYDPKAIAVFCEEYGHVGYIPRQNPENPFSAQKWCWDQLEAGKELIGTADSFAYTDDGGETWNKEGNGVFQSMKIKINNGEPEEKQVNTSEGRHYKKGEDKYQSITQFLKKFPSDPEFLIKWALDSYDSHDEYKRGLQGYADRGTELHDQIERFITGKEAGVLPKGVDAFFEKLQKFKVLSVESKVFDDNLNLAGTYDAFLEINDKKILIDWKSSKAIQDKHKAQAAFYAKNVDADEAWVVCFGSKAKQGYSVSKVDIDLWYNKLELLYKFLNLK